MRIAISGSSGFIGKHLTSCFKEKNHEVIALTRTVLSSSDLLRKSLEKCDVVINLAGASIGKRWTKTYKQEIMSSRVDTTRQLVTVLNNLNNTPSLFISISAVGIYPSTGIHNESSSLKDSNFLAEVCKAWENEATQLKPSIRLVIARLGVVLGRDGGAATMMLAPFRFYIGSIFGTGNQGFSWIHIDDLTRAIGFIIENNSISGVVNLTSPEITSNKKFSKTVAQVLHRPCWFTIPSFIFKLLFGEGHIVITEGQQATPGILQKHGFIFRYPNLYETILSIK